jgi:hypothetical protein
MKKGKPRAHQSRGDTHQPSSVVLYQPADQEPNDDADRRLNRAFDILFEAALEAEHNQRRSA